MQIESWIKLQGDLGRRQFEVYKVLENIPMTTKDLAYTLNLPINSVSGRITELKAMGLIKPAYTVYDIRTNRNVNVWGINQ